MADDATPIVPVRPEFPADIRTFAGDLTELHASLKARADYLAANLKTVADLEEHRSLVAEIGQVVEAYTIMQSASDLAATADLPAAPAPVAVVAPIVEPTAVDAPAPLAVTLTDADIAALAGVETRELVNAAVSTTPPTTPAIPAPQIATFRAASVDAGMETTMGSSPMVRLGSEIGVDGFATNLALAHQTLTDGGSKSVLIAAIDRFAPDQARLTDSWQDNHRLLFGDTQVLVRTAAPCIDIQPEPTIVECAMAPEPLLSLLDKRATQWGQVRVMAPYCIPENSPGVIIPAPDCPPTAAAINCMDMSCLPAAPAFELKPRMACAETSADYIADYGWQVAPQVNGLMSLFAKTKEEIRMQQLRALSIVRSTGAMFGAEADFADAVLRMMAIIRMGLCGVDTVYDALVPKDFAYARLADGMHNTRKHGISGADTLDVLQKAGIGRIVETPWQDPTDPGGARVSYAAATLGNAGTAVLEGYYQTPSIMLVPRGGVLIGQAGRTTYNLTQVDATQFEQGCRKLIVRERETDLIPFGCARPLVLDFTAVGVCGSAPADVACP